MSFSARQPSQNGLASGVIGVGSGRSTSMVLLSRVAGVTAETGRLYAGGGSGVNAEGDGGASPRGTRRRPWGGRDYSLLMPDGPLLNSPPVGMRRGVGSLTAPPAGPLLNSPPVGW